MIAVSVGLKISKYQLKPLLASWYCEKKSETVGARVGAGDADGLGVGAGIGDCDLVGAGIGDSESVGYDVEEPPPHTQHIVLAVKSSSSKVVITQLLG